MVLQIIWNWHKIACMRGDVSREKKKDKIDKLIYFYTIFTPSHQHYPCLKKYFPIHSRFLQKIRILQELFRDDRINTCFFGMSFTASAFRIRKPFRHQNEVDVLVIRQLTVQFSTIDFVAFPPVEFAHHYCRKISSKNGPHQETKCIYIFQRI